LPSLSNRWLAALTGLALLAVGLALAHLASIAGLAVQRNYNEGWNAYHALAAMTGGALYPRPPSLMIDNYPPLSFFVVAAVGKLAPDLVVAGRIVSLLSTLVVGWAVFAIARRMQADTTAALFAAALVLAKLLAASTYVGIDDPQMLGHALGCLGFLLAIGRSGTRRLAVGAFLLTLAVFVKHMLIVQPLALLIWFLWYDRKSAGLFAMFGVLFAVLGFLLCELSLGVNLLEVLFTPRLWRLSWLAQSLKDFLLVSFAPLGAGLYLLLRSRDRHAVLCGLYTLLGVVIGLVFDGGAGVGRNALFDAAIGGGLSAALLLRDMRKPVFAFLFALACLVPLAVAALEKADPSWLTIPFWFQPMKSEAALSQSQIAFLHSRPGPAMCERLALCYWAGKAAEVDMFNFVQAVETGRRKQAELIRLLDERYFLTVEIGPAPRLGELADVMAAIARNYRVVRRSGDGTMLIPRAPVL
jgi:hypothetical protein